MNTGGSQWALLPRGVANSTLVGGGGVRETRSSIGGSTGRRGVKGVVGVSGLGVSVLEVDGRGLAWGLLGV